MTIDGNRHAADLVRLESKRKELEDTLTALARDEDELDRVLELAREIDQLEQQVDAARAAANIPHKTAKRSAIMPDDLQKRALANKKVAERQLDDLAKSLRQPGETFEVAYSRALDTEMGAMMLKTLDDATALASGNPTQFDLEKARIALQ
jgi:small-conductance mechanosensitive channel